MFAGVGLTFNGTAGEHPANDSRKQPADEDPVHGRSPRDHRFRRELPFNIGRFKDQLQFRDDARRTGNPSTFPQDSLRHAMIPGISHLVRLTRSLFGRSRQHKLHETSPSGPKGRGMIVRVFGVVLTLAVITGAGYGVYALLQPPAPPLAVVPDFVDDEKPLPAADQFEDLAKTDPVAMFAKCLARYQREVKGGFRCTLEKTEWVGGAARPTELIQLVACDEFAHGKEPAVRMIWNSGAPKDPFGFEIRATLLIESVREKSENGTTIMEKHYEITTYRPRAPRSTLAVEVNGSRAKVHSRYCMRDCGLYRGLQRTYLAWKARAEREELHVRYLGKREEPKVGGRVCYVVQRTSTVPELDPFEVGGQPESDPAIVERDGFNEVTVFIDAEHWMQVGTIIRRTDVNPPRLIGEYYFRDIELNPEFPPDTFTVEGMKAAAGK